MLIRPELSSSSPPARPRPALPHSARHRPSPLVPVLRRAMEDSGSIVDGDEVAKGGVIACSQCQASCQEGEGARWKKILKDGTVKWYGRCVDCNVWNARMDQVLKKGPHRNQWNSFTMDQKKTFRAENQDKFSEDLSIALTVACEKVALYKNSIYKNNHDMQNSNYNNHDIKNMLYKKPHC